MRKVSLLASIMFCIGIMFSSCIKEENLAAEIAGTYKGTKNAFFKKKAKIEIHQFSLLLNLDAGNELSFQAVARQVFSPL